MKNLIIIFFIILPNLTYADLLDKFSLACICDKSINALKYFDCKQKVSGTQLDLLIEENLKIKFIFIVVLMKKNMSLSKMTPISFLIMRLKIIFLFYQLTVI